MYSFYFEISSALETGVSRTTNQVQSIQVRCLAWLCSRTGQERICRKNEKLEIAANHKVVGRLALLFGKG